MAKEKKENNETVTIKQLYPPSSIIIISFEFSRKKIMHLIWVSKYLAQNT